MITFCPLASGSRGNAAILKTPRACVLFDAGISVKALQDRLATLAIPMESLSAIFISHEHHDHISGVKSIVSRLHIPIIANYATAEAIVENFDWCPKFHIFTTEESFEFLDMQVTPFSVQHDGVDPVAFTVSTHGKKIGICTDLGFVTNRVRHALRGCDILLLEANHQPEMVHSSPRPDIYKRRVLGRTGHLSNEEAARLLIDLSDHPLHRVYLAHLSSECNSPEVAIRIVSEQLQTQSIHLDILAASQHEVSKATTLPLV